MDTINFLKTIYFGDRFCTRIVIDGLNNHLELHVNCISRIRDVSGKWNFHTNEDIENGILIISGVKKINFDDSGLIPNDQIYDVYADRINDNLYEFTIETSRVDEKAQTHDLIIKILGETAYLLDPTNSGVKIIE